MTVLYITQNGITDHIGQSQIAPYVLGLARSGFTIHVLSAEKEHRKHLVGRYAKRFADAGVDWTRVPYRNTPRFVGQALTQRRLERAAFGIVRQENVRLVHCRSHPAALIGRRLRYRNGLPYLFDFRDFYADGGLIKAKALSRLWFARLKTIESDLVRDAAGMVCLTDAARAILLRSYASPDAPDDASRFQVIPCCADFDHFDPDRIDPGEAAQLRQQIGAGNSRNVMLYLGSVGPDYLLPQMLRLFIEYRKLRSDAKFLFVANNGHEEIRNAARRCGASMEDILVTTSTRDNVPKLVSLARLSVIFIRPDLSKAGCSPTKLAELFAMNVPVIGNAGVGDMSKILALQENGSVAIHDFGSETLRQAIISVMTATEKGIDIRSNSRRFDLPLGVKLYADTYRQILGSA